jgi:hypothetical protein
MIVQNINSTIVSYFLSGDKTKYETTIRDLVRAKLQIDAIHTIPAPANAIDAERYRFLQNGDNLLRMLFEYKHKDAASLDAFIDAAMKAAK